jgi:cell division protein FtsQ
MWDNAALLRNIANALLAISVLAMSCGAVYYTAHLPGLLPLKSVRLAAVPQRVSAEEVLKVVRAGVQGNLITVDIEGLRKSLKKLAWVRSVSIRREFPDRLVLELEEHQALARWNNGRLVNQQGEIFAAESEQVLPSFDAQNAQSGEVAQQYQQFSKQLEAVKLSVVRLTVSTRNAWQLQLNNGLVLQLGREAMQQRLARFVTVYPYSIAAMQVKAKYVDLRYRDGMAVGGAMKG